MRIMQARRPPRRRLWLFFLILGPVLAVAGLLGALLLVDRWIGAAEQTIAIEGDPARFDPVAGLPQVMAVAGAGARLESIQAAGVRRDGTLDLTARYTPAPRATYALFRDAAPPDPAPPVGAGGSLDGRWYQSLRIEAYRPGQRRQVTRITGNSRMQYSYVNRGLDIDEGSVSGKAGTAVPPPACRFDRLWADAIAGGAPADAVARIDYDDRGYVFNIPGVFLRHYGTDCTEIRR